MFINNRYILITGAASGIGLGLVQYCLQHGVRQLILLDCDEEAIHRLKAAYAAKKNVQVITIDIGDDNAVKALSNMLALSLPCIDMVINCAGVSGPFGPVWEVPKEQVDWTLTVNLIGTVNVARHFIPLLHTSKHPNPCFVSVSSHLGLVTQGHLFSYQITKHAIVAFTEALQQDCQGLEPSIQFAIFFPYFVKSNLANSGRHLINNQKKIHVSSDSRDFFHGIEKETELGIEAIDAAKILCDGLAANAVYIFTNKQTLQDFNQRIEHIKDNAYC